MRFWKRRVRSIPGGRAERRAAEAIDLKGRAMLAVRYLGEEIAERYGKDAGWTRAFEDGDDAVLGEIAAIACSRAGITVADYRKVYRRDLQLVGAQQRAIDRARAGSSG